MNLLKIIADSFQDNWDEPAVKSLTTGLTLEYAALASRIGRFQMVLEGLGCSHLSRVAILGHNSIDFVSAYMGTLTKGCTAVTIPTTFTPGEILELLAQVNVEYIFTDESWDYTQAPCEDAPDLKGVVSLDSSSALYSRSMPLDTMQEILNGIDLKFSTSFPLGYQKSDVIPPADDPDGTAAIFFSSGTATPPKAIKLSSDNLEGSVIYGIKTLLHPRHSVTYSHLSMSTVWGCVFDMLITLASGGTLVVNPDARTVDDLLEDTRKVHPDKLLTTPRTAAEIYHKACAQFANKRFHGNTLTAWWRRMKMRRAFEAALGRRCQELIIAGTGVESRMMSHLKSIGVRFTVAYGMAECGGLISYTSSDRYKPGTVGRSASSIIKTRIVPTDGTQGMPHGTGMLQVKGMTLMKGYAGMDEDVKFLNNEGWFPTGDLATIDPQGDISIIGRKDTLIERAGMLPVVPEHIELLLESHPQINHALVVLREDDRLVALVWLRPGVECDRSLARNIMHDTNRLLRSHECLSDVELQDAPAAITPKGSLQRWNYI